MATARKDAPERVSDYFAALPDWSRAICETLRGAVLSADPSIIEDWKWGPHYSSGGMVCGIGAFKGHVKLHFFNGSAMPDGRGLFNHCLDNQFARSVKFTDVAEVDVAAVQEYVRDAVAVLRGGFKRIITETSETPDDLLQALQSEPTAYSFFEGLTPGYRKQFTEHVTTAKTEKTRAARVAAVVAHCKDGKRLHDKYKS